MLIGRREIEISDEEMEEALIHTWKEIYRLERDKIGLKRSKIGWR